MQCKSQYNIYVKSSQHYCLLNSLLLLCESVDLIQLFNSDFYGHFTIQPWSKEKSITQVILHASINILYMFWVPLFITNMYINCTQYLVWQINKFKNLVRHCAKTVFFGIPPNMFKMPYWANSILDCSLLSWFFFVIYGTTRWYFIFIHSHGNFVECYTALSSQHHNR